MTGEQKKEFTLRISQANKTQMVVIIYDILLENLKDAKNAIEKEDVLGKRESLNKARACINELIASLHYEYDPAVELLELYVYSTKALVKADLHNHVESIEEVSSIMARLRDAYATVASQDTSAPVMGNTQTVYAGLTYGKSSLMENVTDPAGNRGYLA